MTRLEQLKAAKSIRDIANILGYTASTLAYILYKIPTSAKYKKFEIPKKSGGMREINAPIEPVKTLQRRLADLLYACRTTIEHGKPRRSLSHGFRLHQSIIDNAKPHKSRRFVLNIDLEDFFPTFNFGRVRGFFLKNHDFELHEKVATILAQIACHNNILPQGSPCSPIIADMIAHLLDVRLAQLSKSHRVTYSRYADDLTFSTNQKAFPPFLASQAGAGTAWELGHPLVTTIEGAGFKINAGKTRMQCQTSRQLVTGLTVNTKVNIRSEYYRYARAMCHMLFRTGSYHRGLAVSTEGEALPPVLIKELAQLEGVLNHIYHVKDTIDTRKTGEKKSNPRAARELYADFLFYKYFVRAPKPLVICEGKTDNLYLRTALRNLPAFHPNLGSWSGPLFHSRISFFSYQNKVHDLLDLGGGTGDFVRLLSRWKLLMKTYIHKPLVHPTIILIDNDSGAKSLFNKLKEFGVSIEMKKDDAFYKIIDNLFIIKTPALGSSGSSCIENFFAPSLLATKLEGKAFSFQDKIDPAKEYGKSVFAEKVVVPNAASIDFSKFSTIFERIGAVLDTYKPPAPPAAGT